MIVGRDSKLVAMGLSTVLLSCDPGVIAPLPSPIVPDDNLILTSSLEVRADEKEDFLVAVIGFPRAVKDGLVEITNRRSGLVEVVASSELGSFTAAVFGRAEDVLEIRQVGQDGKRSDAALVDVDPYFEVKNAPPPTETSAQPASPGEYDSAAGGAEADPDDTQGKAARLDVIWSFSGGVLTVDAESGFTTPSAIVIISNVDGNTVNSATADEYGGIRLSIDADAGDQILMFAQSSKNATLTSPAIHFFVPAPGQTDGTDTDAKPAEG